MDLENYIVLELTRMKNNINYSKISFYLSIFLAVLIFLHIIFLFISFNLNYSDKMYDLINAFIRLTSKFLIPLTFLPVLILGIIGIIKKQQDKKIAFKGIIIAIVSFGIFLIIWLIIFIIMALTLSQINF